MRKHRYDMPLCQVPIDIAITDKHVVQTYAIVISELLILTCHTHIDICTGHAIKCNT